MMKAIILVVTLALSLALSLAYYQWQKPFPDQLLQLTQTDTLGAPLSKLWLSSCPSISSSEVAPNSLFGVVAAAAPELQPLLPWVLSTLVDCGYPVDERDEAGLSALQAAVLYGEVAAVEQLLLLGADAQLVVEGRALQKFGAVNALQLAQQLPQPNAQIIALLSAAD